MTNLADIKVGDRVWVEGRPAGVRVRRILTVECVTPKQFKLSNGDYYWRRDGRLVARYGFGTVAGIATPQEVRDFEQAEYAAGVRKNEETRERLRADAERANLKALFNPTFAPHVERLSNTLIDGVRVDYSLTLYGSEADVRRWADKLKGEES